MQRFTKSNRCPVCSGYETAERGTGKRCFGFVSEDGKWVNCSREEYGGALSRNPSSGAYVHRLEGSCNCGNSHGQEPTRASKQIVATYDYVDETGVMLFQVVRYEPKQFMQRKPDGGGEWVWKLGDVRRVLYRLPQLLAAPDSVVYLVEGEKDADLLVGLGLLATTNAGGAEKWREAYNENLRGRKVIILPDNDEPGRRHAQTIVAALQGVAESVKVIELPGLPDKGDVSDWISSGGTVDLLVSLVNATQVAPVVAIAPKEEPASGLERPEPSSEESERAVLGTVTNDNSHMPLLVDLIKSPDWFHIVANRRIWVAMLTLYDSRTEINPLLIAEVLKWDNDLIAVGGLPYITKLSEHSHFIKDLRIHVDLLREKYTLRQQLKINRKFIDRLYEDEGERSGELITLQENELGDLRATASKVAGTGGTLADLVPIIDSHLSLIESGQNPAIATGLPNLDRATGGGPTPGEMWGTAALSSQGKTALTLQQLKFMAEQGKYCILFSLEMVTLMNCLRILAAEAEIPMFHIKFGLDHNRIRELRAALPQLAKLPIRIYNDCRSVGEMVSRIRMIKRREPVHVVAIDSFNRASGHGGGRDHYENRTQELKYIANAIQQQICQDENVAGLVPTQFNRTAWSAAEPGPQHIDGGEAYYQACDLFAALKTKAAKKGAEQRESSLNIYKQRNGPPDKILLWFHGPSMSFCERKEKPVDALDEGDEDTDTPNKQEPPPADRERFL